MSSHGARLNEPTAINPFVIIVQFMARLVAKISRQNKRNTYLVVCGGWAGAERLAPGLNQLQGMCKRFRIEGGWANRVWSSTPDRLPACEICVFVFVIV